MLHAHRSARNPAFKRGTAEGVRASDPDCGTIGSSNGSRGRATAQSAPHLRELLQRERNRRFVGRTIELRVFSDHLERTRGDASPAAVWVHGPGGIGKSTLLEAYAHVARAAGRRVAALDARRVGSNREAIRAALLNALGAADSGLVCADRPVVLLDTVEAWAADEDWLREELLPSLPGQSLVVVAHRRPPGHRWLADAGWRRLMYVLPLGDLDRDAVRGLLAIEGFPERLLPDLMRLTHGHPLATALCLEALRRSGTLQVPGSLEEMPGLVDQLLEGTVDEAPSGGHRLALQATAHAAITTEPVLRAALPGAPEHQVSQLWQWLRGLPFVEDAQVGLRPAPLIRAVVEADLRRRDPEGYADLHGRLRTHLVEQLRRSADHPATAQQAAEELLFLARPLLGDQPDGPEPDLRLLPTTAAGPADVHDAVALARSVRGAGTGLAHWLERHAEYLRVVRDDAGVLSGFGVRLPLQLAQPEDLAADPETAALLDHVERHAPARPGEQVLAWLFVLAPDAAPGERRRVAATFRAWHLEDILLRGSTAWEFVVLDEKDTAWAELLSNWDFDTLPGDGSGVVRFAHDWRRMGVELWLERTAVRELGEQLPDQTWDEAAALSYEEFTASVKQVLRDLHRPSALLRNPLLATGIARARRRADPELRPDRVLRALVADAAQVLRVDPKSEHLFRVLDRTYLRPAPTQEKAAEILDLPFTTYRRYRDRAIARISDWLWELDVDSGVLSA